ncbi:MAG: flagellar basal body rod protein FlgC [Rhodobacterales bacterium]|nr:MAG: flagellar basal body rod protein FlgC [Rhodobacterales bacterium]
MADLLSSARFTAVSGMQAQADRLRHTSENIANADTPGYRRKIASFEQVMDGGRQTGRVRSGKVRLDRSELPRVFDPSHPMADATGYYEGSNVDLVIELADAREARRSYEANLKMFGQAREMTHSLLDLLKR